LRNSSTYRAVATIRREDLKKKLALHEQADLPVSQRYRFGIKHLFWWIAGGIATPKKFVNGTTNACGRAMGAS